jgi:radical SAM superfamily enzyme
VTGDPHPEELIAPAWALEKSENLRTLHAFMEDHGLYQGRDYKIKGTTF